MTSKHGFETGDLALVCYLSFRGIDPEDMILNGEIVHWRFKDTPDLKGYSHEYKRGDAMVEVTEFMRRWGSIRKRMFRFKEEQQAIAS